MGGAVPPLGAKWRYQPKAAWFVVDEKGIRKVSRGTDSRVQQASPERDPSHGRSATFTGVHWKDTNIITW